jgi:iron complex outermembrane receptor protein
MEWMFNLHGTQNRGDSTHLQMIGATTKVNQPGFFEARQNGFAENAAAARAGFELGEGTRNVDGVSEPIPFGGGGQGGGNPYSGFYSSDGTKDIDAWGINGRGFWDLGAVVITLLYDYEWYDRVIEDEGDANPSVVFPAIWSDSAWQTTEDLRVEREGERYTWTAGFFFLYEDLDATQFLPRTSSDFETTETFQQKLTSWAPYANTEIDLVEEGVIPGIYGLTLGGGIRYNHEKKEFEFVRSMQPAISAQIRQKTSRETTWSELTGDVQLSYTPFANEYGTLLSYLKYGRGFNSGDFNVGLTVSGGNSIRNQIEEVKSESIDAVEFGLRTRWFDDRLAFDAAVFRYWYHDLPVFDIGNEVGELPTRKLFNGDAKIRGAEVELRVKPLPGLLLSANFGWLDSEFKDFAVTKSVASPGGGSESADFNYAGNPLVAAPEWNFAGIAEFEMPLFGWGSLIPHWDVNYRSKAYFDPQMLDPISQNGYWIHNARIAYRTPYDRIELAFWVANVFDEEYKVDAFDPNPDYNTLLEAWGEPRTYGVTLSLNW